MQNPRRKTRGNNGNTMRAGDMLSSGSLKSGSRLTRSKFPIIKICSSNAHESKVLGSAFGGGDSYQSWAVSVGTDKDIFFWKFTKGAKRTSLEAKMSGWKSCVDWENQRGSTLAIGSTVGDVNVYNEKCWSKNASKGKTKITALLAENCHDGFVNAIKYSKLNPNEIYTCSTDWSVSVMDLEKPEKFTKIRGHYDDVTDLAVQKGLDDFVVTSSADRTCKIWDKRASDPAKIFDEHESVVNSVCFVGEHNDIISASDDGTCRLYDFREGYEKKRFFDPQQQDVPITSVSLVANHFILGLQGGVVKIWDVDGAEDECVELGWDAKAPITSRTSSVNVHQREKVSAIITTYMDKQVRTWNVIQP